MMHEEKIVRFKYKSLLIVGIFLISLGLAGYFFWKPVMGAKTVSWFLNDIVDYGDYKKIRSYDNGDSVLLADTITKIEISGRYSILYFPAPHTTVNMTFEGDLSGEFSAQDEVIISLVVKEDSKGNEYYGVTPNDPPLGETVQHVFIINVWFYVLICVGIVFVLVTIGLNIKEREYYRREMMALQHVERKIAPIEKKSIEDVGKRKEERMELICPICKSHFLIRIITPPAVTSCPSCSKILILEVGNILQVVDTLEKIDPAIQQVDSEPAFPSLLEETKEVNVSLSISEDSDSGTARKKGPRIVKTVSESMIDDQSLPPEGYTVDFGQPRASKQESKGIESGQRLSIEEATDEDGIPAIYRKPKKEVLKESSEEKHSFKTTPSVPPVQTKKETCPVCLQEVEPEWTECKFCLTDLNR
ncbi:MAG: hypothetical protein QW728_01800 [Thermoplasmata archaeon]